jgi:hypothetical protein
MRLICFLGLAAAVAACGGASGKGQCSGSGSVECVTDTIARVCAADGTWTEQQCSSDQQCMGSGGCVARADISCNFTDSGCVDSTHAVVCNSDGKGFQAVTCPTATTCSGFGECAGTCTVGSSSCENSNTVVTCTDGFTLTQTNCTPGMTSCVQTSNSGAFETAACKPASCVDNGPTCGNKASDPTSTDPDYASFCQESPSGLQWSSEKCIVPGSCTEGNGCDQTCVPGAQRCFGDGIQVCDTNSNWAAITPCQPTATGLDQVCMTPTGSPTPLCGDRVCSVAPGACEADGYHPCVNGKVATAASPCTTGVCVGSQNYDGFIAGSCQAQCNPGDTRCISNEAYEACGASNRWSSTVSQCPANGTDKCIGYNDPSNGAQKSICGACVPGTHRCTNSGGTPGGTYIETCDATGHYGSPAQCAMGQCQASSNDSACVMQCVPNSTVCVGGAPGTPSNPSHPGTVNWGTCDAAGNLPASSTACGAGTSCRKHSNGQAVGAGAAACVQCVGTDNENGFSDTACITSGSPNSIETCSASNMWNAATLCASTSPYSGVCKAEPYPQCGGSPYYEGSFCTDSYLTAIGYGGCAGEWGVGTSTWGTTSDCCNIFYCQGYSSSPVAPASCE